MACYAPYIPAFVIEALCLGTNASYPSLTTMKLKRLMTTLVVYSLAVDHETFCIPSLQTSSKLYRCLVLNNLGVSIVLTHTTIQVAYCHYMLTLSYNVCGILKLTLLFEARRS